MIISLFSGQGSQYPGMGHDITEAFPQLCSLYDNASDILGKDLKSICFDASQDELTATVNAQPAVMITSLVCLEAAKLSGFSFVYTFMENSRGSGHLRDKCCIGFSFD